MLFLLLLLLLSGEVFAASNNIQIQIKEKAIVQEVLSPFLQKLQGIDLAKQDDIAKIQQVQNELQRFKNVNIFKPLNLIGKSNLYWIAGSVAFTLAVDSLVQKIEEEKEKQKAKILPAGACVRAIDYGDHSSMTDALVATPGELRDFPCSKYFFQGYRCSNIGSNCPLTCIALYKLVGDDLCPKSGYLIGYSPGTGTLVDDASPLQNSCGPDFQYCQEPLRSEVQNKPRPPAPFVVPPDILDKSTQNIPETTTYTIPLSDSVKTPSDIQNIQPLTDALPPNVKIDIPYGPGDGNISPVPSPSNPILDIANDKGDIQVIYNINNNAYNEYNTSNSTSTNKEDYTFTSPQADFDTKVDVPKKQDIPGLVQEMQSYLKSYVLGFFQGVELNSSQCSFTVPNPFGGIAVLDFCQYQNVVNLIGQIVLAFSYLYAIYIIFKVE